MRRLLFFMLLLPLSLMAQKITVEEYIETYKDIAMSEMRNHKIPASITLAQGIIESGAGNSALAREAKNHFGIKCHKEWKGKTYTMDDDEKDECFRVYKNAEESFRDHSEFLTSRPRYADLFKLDIMDYRAWANGLKAAGYATNPAYATMLINRIELNKLYLYDQLAMGKINENEAEKQIESEEENTSEDIELELAYSPVDKSAFELVDMTANKRFIYENNGVRFLYAKEGETPESLSKELRIRKRQLCQYNLVKRPDEMVFHHGDVVYLGKLRNNNRKVKKYVAEGNESVRDLALRFAVQPERIIKMNKLENGKTLKAGQKIRLR
jgi:hypothetical protein